MRRGMFPPSGYPAFGERPAPFSVAPAAGAAAAVPPAAAGAAPPALGPGLGLVDRQRPPARVLAVEGLDGGLGLLVAAHLHEAEASRLAGLPIRDHLCRLNGAVGRE